jgi:hypothetical protein
MRLRIGSVLPLALIMTAMILMAGIAIGSVVLQGSRLAVKTDESVGAYYMADSGVERQLFEIRKNSQTLDYVKTLNQTTAPTYPGGMKWASTAALEANLYSKTFPIVATSSFAQLDLFDPDHMNTPPGIGDVVIHWSADPSCGAMTPKLEASYAYWDLTGGTPVWPTDNQFKVYPRNGTGSLEISDLNTNQAYRLRLTFYDCAAQNVTVSTFASSGGAAVAIPGDITLSAEGTFGSTTQNIAVTMPKQDVLSGLFGYVLFSECTLYKGTGTAPACP